MYHKQRYKIKHQKYKPLTWLDVFSPEDISLQTFQCTVPTERYFLVYVTENNCQNTDAHQRVIFSFRHYNRMIVLHDLNSSLGGDSEYVNPYIPTYRPEDG